MKIVVNRCFGGFSLSPIAVKAYAKANGKKCFNYKQTKSKYQGGIDEYTKVFFSNEGIMNMQTSKDFGAVTNDEKGLWENYLTNRPEERTDPKLVEVVEKLGSKANGYCAELAVIEIPDGVDWVIDDYDGVETVDEVHRSW